MTKHNDTLAADIDEWVEHLMGGYTEEQLAMAFGCVKDLDNWKRPIEIKVAPTVRMITREMIKCAIDFYAGGGAEFTDNADGSYTVKAPGYYEMIGS